MPVTSTPPSGGKKASRRDLQFLSAIVVKKKEQSFNYEYCDKDCFRSYPTL